MDWSEWIGVGAARLVWCYIAMVQAVCKYGRDYGGCACLLWVAPRFIQNLSVRMDWGEWIGVGAAGLVWCGAAQLWYRLCTRKIRQRLQRLLRDGYLTRCSSSTEWALCSKERGDADRDEWHAQDALKPLIECCGGVVRGQCKHTEE